MKKVVYLLMLLSVIMFAVQTDRIEANTNDCGPAVAVDTVDTYVTAPIEPSALEAFFDQTIARQLEDRHIPGAALAIVQDGKVVFARGYGYADLEQERLAVADQTLFRTGSVAKLFTWTAVMQLVEQEKLDLDTDVNDYLGSFQIPNIFSEPITLEYLMTHTAGFEDGPAGMMRSGLDDLEPLETFLARKIPARVFPPGQVTAYSNYGTALASYIVERVTGVPFEQYVEENILMPLDMDRSTFYQPVPQSMKNDLATGYVYREGNYQPQPFEIFEIAPAGGSSATVTDMAKFMMAHLQDGKYGDSRILGEDTSLLMHQRHFSNDSRLAGMALGFYELRVNGQLLLTHAGETAFFRSQLLLFPQEELGLYVVYNAPGGGFARLELIQAFFDRFFPAEDFVVSHSPAGAVQRADQFAGRYVSTRSAQTTIEKVRLLFEPSYQPITVRATRDGTLESVHPLIKSQNPALYQPSRWTEAEPNLYVRTDGEDMMAFHQDDLGNTMMFLDSAAPRGYRKLGWFEELLFQPFLPLGLVVVLVGLTIFTAFDRQSLPAVRWLALSSAGIVLALVIGLAAFALLGFTSYLYGKVSFVWRVVLVLPLVLIMLSAFLAVATLQPWPGASILRRVPYILIVLASAGLVVWSGYWNLIGWCF
ncbi:MAG: beta-lactamase family protein [Anaerolineales bacterium]|nr:beta-lactamase family protein [Anaerolineales bacterium]